MTRKSVQKAANVYHTRKIGCDVGKGIYGIPRGIHSGGTGNKKFKTLIKLDLVPNQVFRTDQKHNLPHPDDSHTTASNGAEISLLPLLGVCGHVR